MDISPLPPLASQSSPPPGTTENRSGLRESGTRSAALTATSTTAPADNASSQLGKPADRKQLEEAATRIKEFVAPVNDSIQFSLDEDTGRTLLQVIDVQTKEVIRQIPSEEVLNIAKALDKLQGLLIHNKA